MLQPLTDLQLLTMFTAYEELEGLPRTRHPSPPAGPSLWTAISQLFRRRLVQPAPARHWADTLEREDLDLAA